MQQITSELHPGVAKFLSDCQIDHQIFPCDPELADTAAFCAHYGFELKQSANAIIVASRSEPIKYACCVVLANSKLDVNKKVCQLLDVKKASFASAEQTSTLTGMLIGGVTPFGLPAGLPIYFDAAVMDNDQIVLGGGNRSTKVLLNPQELSKLPGAQIIENLAQSK